MPDFAPIGPGSLGPVGRDTPVGRTSSGSGSTNPAVNGESSSNRATDRVELSDRARWLDQLQALPPVRRELVERLQGEIQSGNYPSDEQLTIAIDRLIADLNG